MEAAIIMMTKMERTPAISQDMKLDLPSGT
jgi:hypothetical protein